MDELAQVASANVVLPHQFNVGDRVDHASIPGKKGGVVVEIFEDWLNMRVTYKVKFSCSCCSTFCEDELKKAEVMK